ncbi:helix-turn-helix transcriptional regulator [Paraglaciecola aquimarina]
MRIKGVCLLVSVSRSTIYRMLDEGSIPKPLDFR